MKPLLATLALVASILIAVSLLTGGTHDSSPPSTTAATATTTLRPVPAPRLTAKQIDRQDPPGARRQRQEARAFDRRPLLNALPTTMQGVRFEIAGLAADARSTIVEGDARGLGRRRAQIAWETLLRRTGDRSGSYRLRIQP